MRTEPQDKSLEKDLIGNLFLGIQFIVLDHTGTQKPLQPCSKGNWLLLKVTAEVGLMHVVLVLCIGRMKELWGQEGFLSDFRGPVMPGSVSLLGQCVKL